MILKEVWALWKPTEGAIHLELWGERNFQPCKLWLEGWVGSERDGEMSEGSR